MVQQSPPAYPSSLSHERSGLFPPEAGHSEAREHRFVDRGSFPTRANTLAALFVVTFALVCYSLRVSDLPIRGEESRWAQGAFEMLRTGDWVVPRQQGQVFAERPPMNSWLMALFSLVAGGLTPWAVRFPSVMAVALTALVLYVYCRRWLSPAGACVSAMIYCSFGQVLQIGRLGESEAVLAFFTTLSLLGWHHYWLREQQAKAWCLGFIAAGLGALTKGLQAPIYFIAVTSIYLLIQRTPFFFRSRDWWVGLLCMLGVISTWLIPFWRATDWQTVQDIWTGLVKDRVNLAGLFRHMGLYPFEVFGCLLPWSLFVVQWFQKDFRKSLGHFRVPLVFAIVALCVTFPSVWMVAGARGRYFMPLYGIASVPLGLTVWLSLTARVGTWGFHGWWRFARFMALAGCVVTGLLGLSQMGVSSLQSLRQPVFWGVAAVVGTLLLTLILITQCWCARSHQLRSQHSNDQAYSGGERLAIQSFVVTFSLVAWMLGSFAVNLNNPHGNHLQNRIALLSGQLPDQTPLVSFGPIHHRFEYHWQRSIEQLAWPLAEGQVDNSLDYFCFDYHVRDNAEYRHSGRGRTWTTTPSSLPFAWEEVARIPLEREYTESSRWVIVGRARKTSRGTLAAPDERSNLLWR